MASNKNEKLLAGFLRESRIKAGLSQKDVADRLGYSTAQFISNWERGLSSPPVDTLKRLTEILNAKPKDLVNIILLENKKELEKNLCINQTTKSKKQKHSSKS